MYKLVASSSAILGFALIGACHEHKTVQVAPPQSAQAEPVQPATNEPAEANEPVAGPGEQTQVGERGGACPTSVAGTKVNMVDVAGGIALDFTAKSNVAALRERVHQLASTPNNGLSSSGIGDENAGQGSDTNPTAISPPDGVRVPALATVEDLPDGARLILTPQDQGQLPSLRAQTEAQLPQLDQGDCSGLAISNVARTPEPKANRTPQPIPRDPQQPLPTNPDENKLMPPDSSQPLPQPGQPTPP